MTKEPWEEGIKELLNDYANAVYLVSEENHDIAEEDAALENVLTEVRHQRQLARIEALREAREKARGMTKKYETHLEPYQRTLTHEFAVGFNAALDDVVALLSQAEKELND